MSHQEQRQAELARARELIAQLDPVDPHRLGLYAVLRTLEDEASAHGQWSTATIVERKIYDQEEGGGAPEAYGYGLFVCGTVLGHGGEEGWQAIGERVASEQGLPGCFMPSHFTIIQHPHSELNWRGAEQAEVETEIDQRRTALEAAMEAAHLAAATVEPKGIALRRGL